MNVLSSKVNLKTLEHQMINLWRIARSFKVRSMYSYPQKLCLSGTPLNETLVSLHQILPQFQKENGVEKVQCIVLTDGEASQLSYRVEVDRHWEDEPFLGTRHVNPHTCFLRDRKIGKTYKIGYAYHEFTDMLLNNLKDNFSSINFIGIRVLEKRDARHFMRKYSREYSPEYNKNISDWKKLKTFTINSSGYDAYFALSSNNLSDDADFDVVDDATKAQIKRAFVKSLKVKKLNKKVLGEFISLVV